MPPPPKPKRAADADPVARFGVDLTAIVGEKAVAQQRFGIAVSGGPDSMALLHLAHRLLGARMAAATVDHGLRAESADEAATVHRWCAEKGIDHAILHPAQPITGSIQAAARDARYALLHQWREEQALDWLLTAHHADDQLETLLMRLKRGSGVGGLASIRRRNGAIIRPLLGWRRLELEQVCEREGLPFFNDPSNADITYDRSLIRWAIADVDFFDVLDGREIGPSMRALDEANQALDWTAARLIAAWPHHDDPMTLYNDAYPPELLRRVVILRLSALDPAPALRGPALSRLVERMNEHQPAMIGDWRIVPDRKTPGLWRILRAPARKARPAG